MSAAPNNSLHAIVADGFDRFGRENYSFEQRKPALASLRGYRSDAWDHYAELGWLALRLPEQYGGLDADAAMISGLMEAVGRHLLMEPLLASAILGAGVILRAGPERLAQHAPALADGSLKLAAARNAGTLRVTGQLLSGEIAGVLHGDAADRCVVIAQDAGGFSLHLVDVSTAGVTRYAYRLVDGRHAARFVFDHAEAERLGGQSAVDTLVDEGTVALCAEALGSADRLLEATVAYLNVRKQFGRTIGSYQALQHRVSEMYLLRQEIRALTEQAQAALGESAGKRARVISGAAAYTIGATRTIANDAIQLHGGVGVTEELDVSHHFRRLMVNASLLGGRDMQLEAFGRACMSAGDAGGHG